MEYGICNLGNVPIRANAKDQAEIVSFLLFGEHFKIKAVHENWMQIITHYDNYEGWICGKQYKEITHADYDHFSLNKFPVCASNHGEATHILTGEVTPISLGAVLPYYHKEKFKLRNEEYTTNINLASFNIKDLTSYCLAFSNTPYLWGGRSPLGIDCSGYSQLVYRLCGVELPRDAYQQAELGELIQLKESTKGDLAFFQNKEGKINHVGIILDNNKIIHSSGKVRIDELNNKGIYNLELKKISHSYHSIKRFF